MDTSKNPNLGPYISECVIIFLITLLIKVIGHPLVRASVFASISHAFCSYTDAPVQFNENFDITIAMCNAVC